MSEEYKKQRYSVWLSKDAVQKSDAAVVMEGLTNRSDFIEKAIHFYSGYLYQEKHMDFCHSRHFSRYLVCPADSALSVRRPDRYRERAARGDGASVFYGTL